MTTATLRALRLAVLPALEMRNRRFLSASASPRAAQEQRLLQILRRNQDTEYGRTHGFAGVRTLSDFQTCVPITDYDGLAPHIKRMLAGERRVLTHEEPTHFLTTSGTSASPKFIPVTPSYQREYANRLQFYHLLRAYPDAASPGAVFSVVSPAVEGTTPDGRSYGAASGLTYLSQPALFRVLYAVPYDVFTVRDASSRYYLILRLILECRLRLMVVANPSTLLLLARLLDEFADDLVVDVGRGTLREDLLLSEKLRARIVARLRPNPARAAELEGIRARHGALLPREVWPTLRALTCWKDGSAGLYLPLLVERYGNLPVLSLGYMASEGLGTLRVPGAQGDVLAVQGHFFEFCERDEWEAVGPEHARLLACDELEVGKQYYVFFTTSAGLYRYHINDVVEVTGFFHRTPTVRFLHKGGQVFSFTGEKVSEYQVVAAAAGAAEALGKKLVYFAVLPVFEMEMPYYRLLLELPEGEEIPGDRFAVEFDRRLEELNIEYQAKRASLRLGPVRAEALPVGLFNRLREELQRSGRDSQAKFRHLDPGEAFCRVRATFPEIAA